MVRFDPNFLSDEEFDKIFDDDEKFNDFCQKYMHRIKRFKNSNNFTSLFEVRTMDDILRYHYIKDFLKCIENIPIRYTNNMTFYIKHEDLEIFKDDIMEYYKKVYNKTEDKIDTFVLNYEEHINTTYCVIINNELLVQMKMHLTKNDDYSNIDADVMLYYSNQLSFKKYKKEIEEFFNQYEKVDKVVSIKYYYMSNNGSEEIYTFRDIMPDIIHTEAYPWIDNLDKYIDAYLKSDEPLLFIYGPAGTGKSRFMRYIMQKMMSRNKDWSTEVLYTSDKQILERTDIFLDYISSNNDNLLILEDMDNVFISREIESSNTVMNKFLSSSDGLIQTLPSKKMIFCSNIENIQDVDKALVRKGRCFDSISFRYLTFDESVKLLEKLCPVDDSNKYKKYLDEIKTSNGYTIAEIYEVSKKIINPDLDVPRYKRIISNKIGF